MTDFDPTVTPAVMVLTAPAGAPVDVLRYLFNYTIEQFRHTSEALLADREAPGLAPSAVAAATQLRDALERKRQEGGEAELLTSGVQLDHKAVPLPPACDSYSDDELEDWILDLLEQAERFLVPRFSRGVVGDRGLGADWRSLIARTRKALDQPVTRHGGVPS